MTRILTICALLLLLIGCNRYVKQPADEKIDGLWLMETYEANTLVASDTLEINVMGSRLHINYKNKKENNPFLEPSFEDNTLRYHIFKNDTTTYYTFKEIDLDQSGFNYIEEVEFKGGKIEGWEEHTETIKLKKLTK